MLERQMTVDQLVAMRGTPVYDSSGEKIGAVEEIYYDETTSEPQWIGIGTGFLGMKHAVVPLAGTTMSSDSVTVAYSKEQVKDAPDIDIYSSGIAPETERDLYGYYGLEYQAEYDTGLPETGFEDQLRDGVEEAVVTRHEEELGVGTRSVQAGSVRLTKWVETEPVQVDVELQRETAHVTREAVDQPVSDASIGEEEVEVLLTAEEAVADKRTVAKERIGIEKDVETDVETVTEQVRKERVEVEGAEDPLSR